jgi:4'-phosphopantetheinyl transferase
MHGAPEDDGYGARPDTVLARALLRAILSKLTSSRKWTIGRSASGAPFVLGLDKSPGPSVSVSHSGGWVACAACLAGPVGIDIEMRKRARNLLGIAQYAFGPEEQLAARAGMDRFYAIWVLREAIAKATGDGLSRVTDQIDRVATEPFQGECWSRFDNADWWLAHLRPRADIDLGIAFRLGASSRPQMKLHWWSP